MKYVKFLAALLAVCTLIIIPAFSMPDCGNAMKDCKKQIDSPCQGPIKGDIADGQKPCPCSEDKMGPHSDKCAPKSMMDGKMEMNSCDKPIMGQDGDKLAPKAMTDGCDKSMMGPDGDKLAPKAMTDGCDKSMMGPDGGKLAPKAMTDGCDKSMMGPDGDKCAPKPMNGPDNDMDQECPCHSP